MDYISANQVEEFVNNPEIVGLICEKFDADISKHQYILREKLVEVYDIYRGNIANMLLLNLRSRDEYFQNFLNFLRIFHSH